MILPQKISKVFAVLGSGFGLYGYLPALLDGYKNRILLPVRYRNQFHARPELQKFESAVQWVSDENVALSKAVGAALALRPIDQEVWLDACLSRGNLRYLLLEKPLARTPELSQIALDVLIKSKKSFKIGYIFRFTNWGKKLLNILGAKNYSGRLLISWSFCAHHYQHDLSNWKRFVSMGGGPIRFFGIHLLALLAEIGYQQVIVSRTLGESLNEIEIWSATIVGHGLPECELMIDTKSTYTSFQVRYSQRANDSLEVWANLLSPLEIESSPTEQSLEGVDPRTTILKEHLNGFQEVGDGEIAWYQRTIDLWRSVEDRSSFELIRANTVRSDLIIININISDVSPVLSVNRSNY